MRRKRRARRRSPGAGCRAGKVPTHPVLSHTTWRLPSPCFVPCFAMSPWTPPAGPSLPEMTTSTGFGSSLSHDDKPNASFSRPIGCSARCCCLAPAYPVPDMMSTCALSVHPTESLCGDRTGGLIPPGAWPPGLAWPTHEFSPPSRPGCPGGSSNVPQRPWPPLFPAVRRVRGAADYPGGHTTWLAYLLTRWLSLDWLSTGFRLICCCYAVPRQVKTLRPSAVVTLPHGTWSHAHV